MLGALIAKEQKPPRRAVVRPKPPFDEVLHSAQRGAQEMQQRFEQAYVNRHCWRGPDTRQRIEKKADQSMKEAPIYLNHLGVTLFRSARPRG